MNDNDLFISGIKACSELKLHLSGQKILKDIEVLIYKELVKTASRKSFYFFCKFVLGFSKLSKNTHKVWCDKHQEDWKKLRYLGRLKPRGTFKTTIYAEGFILWIWATVSQEIKFFYTSASQALIDEVSSHLGQFIQEETESLYSFIFNIRKDKLSKNTEDIFNLQGRDKNSKGFSLIFRTAGGSTNGVHPNIIIVDDPMDKEDRESQAVRLHKERWFESLYPLLVPFTMPDGTEIKQISVIATRWHLNDLVAHLMRKPDWDFDVESCYNSDGSARFPEILPDETLEEIKKNISEIFFSCQYLNNPLPEGLQVFKINKLHFLNYSHENIEQGSNYCFFDPSKGKKGGDFPAVIWINLFNGRKFIFDAIDIKTELDELIKLIAKMNRDFKVKEMVFETNGSMGLEDCLYRAHHDLNYNLAIEGIHETRNKVERIMAIQPDIYRENSFYFREDWRKYYPELMNQLIFFPAWEHDDFPDIIEKAVTWFIKFEPSDFIEISNGQGSKGTFANSLNKKTGSLSSQKKW